LAAAFQTTKIRPIYKGDFQLLVEPVTNADRATDPITVTRGTGDAIPSRDVFSLDYATQIQILESPSRLDKIVKEVQRTPAEAGQDRPPFANFTFQQLQGGLTVKRLQPKDSTDPTRIITVTYQDSDPVLVQRVLQATSKNFLDYSIQERKDRFSEGIRFIDEQLPEAQKRVNNIQDQIQTLRQRNELIDPATQGGQLTETVNTINSQQLDANRALQEQRVLYDNLRSQLQLTPEEAIAASALSEDPSYLTLQASLVTLETQIAAESARFNEDSPILSSLRQKQKNTQDLLTQRAQQVIGQSLPGGSARPQVQAFQNSVRIDLINKLVDAGNQIRVLDARSQKIAQDRRSFDGRLQRFPAVARQYTDLTRELEIATQTLTRLQTQRETLRVEAAQTRPPWELISQPVIPRDADGNPQSEPTKASNLMIAGVGLGLLLGTLLALLLERYRNVFYTIEDIQEAIKLPLVGVIPFSRGAKQSLEFPSGFGTSGEIEDSRLETASFRESFSDLYSNIRSAIPPIRSLMVCSAEPGDGKTTAALYLAQTASGTGQRVLLVDTNLRLPQIHTRLDLRNSRGLSDLLTGYPNPEELIQRSPLAENLFVLTAGSSTPGSARLLGSDQMKQIMEKFQTLFDLVIYDTPHLFGLTDASFITAQVDEVLMVIAAGKTNRTAVDRVLNKLMGLRAARVSLVVNYLREANSPNAYSRYSQTQRDV
jgi:polysaccharide biosynthesis transport protein